MSEIWGWNGKIPALGGYVNPRDRVRAMIHLGWLNFLRSENLWDEHLPEVKDFNSRIKGV